MPATASAVSLVDRYAAAFPGSKKRFETAKGVFPTGVTHDTRMMDPFPVYIDRARGSKKWDHDGHSVQDYCHSVERNAIHRHGGGHCGPNSDAYVVASKPESQPGSYAAIHDQYPRHIQGYVRRD